MARARIWLKGRAKEKTTYQGIIAALGGVGIINDPDAFVEVLAAMAIIIGFIQSITKEKPDPEDDAKKNS